jgi:hypothetical protein
MTTLERTIIGATLAAAVGTGIYQGRQASRLRHEVQALQQQQAGQIQQLQRERDEALKRLARLSTIAMPSLPAPPVQFTAAPPATVKQLQPADLCAHFQGLKDKAPNKLTAGQLESYLNSNQRNAASLLAAYRATGEPAFLDEAKQRFSADPQVALEAVFRKDAPPQERRQWLEAFKQSDPDNALPDYLSALDYFKAGQTDQAVQELMAASSKQQFEDYTAQRQQYNEQAYLAAGYSLAEARAIAPLQRAILTLGEDGQAEALAPLHDQQLVQVKELCAAMADLGKAYAQAGDQASAQAAWQMAVNLGRRYSDASGANGTSRLVGLSAEIIVLSRLDPTSPFGNGGQTVQDRVNQIRQQRTPIKELYQNAVPLMGTMSDQDWTSYGERAKAFGELAALQWVIGKFGQK